MNKPFISAGLADHEIKTVLERWNDDDPYPRIIVDLDHHIIWQNSASRAIIAECKELDCRGDVFTFVDASSNMALTNMMSASTKSGSSGVIHSLDGTRYVLVVQRLDAPNNTLVFGISYRRVDQMRYADLRALFSLTKAEEKILHHLLAGAVADSIAEQNAISLETVRSHIRAIYSKVGVSSREALFNRVSLYRVP